MLRRHQFFICFLIFYIQHSSRGNPLTGPNVKNAEKDEFPFAVSLSRKYPVRPERPEWNHFCGGALITDTHVLTAAHCFNKIKSRKNIVVKVNNGDLRESMIYKVNKWTTYGKWAKQKITNNINDFDDIAIIELEEKISSNIKPAVITNLTEAELYGLKVVTASWGLTFENPNSDQRPRYLQTAKLNVLKPDECLRNLEDDVKGQINSTTHRFICTSAEPPVYVECGDSGSPLLTEAKELIGINKGYCVQSMDDTILLMQNLHMSINYYREFITDVITHKKYNTSRSNDRPCSIL